MTKLISMVDYIIQAHEACVSSTTNNYNYAKFLKTPLSIEQFVPCKLVYGVWQVVEEPDGDNYKHNDELSIPKFNYNQYKIDSEEYEQAKSLCLFEGFNDSIGHPQYSHYISDGMQAVFYITKNGSTWSKILGMKTIEDLTNKTPVTLTPNTIKIIGI